MTTPPPPNPTVVAGYLVEHAALLEKDPTSLQAIELCDKVQTWARIIQRAAATQQRQNGATWQQIADLAGITKQAAWEKWSEDRDGSSYTGRLPF